MNLTAHTDVAGYAAARGVSYRTVQNWLANDRLPGAVKLGGRWTIPLDAEPIEPSIAQVALPLRPDIVPVPEPAPVRTRHRPVAVADLAAEWGVTAETVRRWAKNGDGGLRLSVGPHGAHYVWVEML